MNPATATRDRTATTRAAVPELVLGRYRLGERLGAGGFGTVWRARDERLERDVAVKVVPRSGDAAGEPSERAEREARVAARLNHPGIVSLYEQGADDHAIYIVSELVQGGTLAELVQAGAVSDRDIARIGIVLCDALEHAHSQGVIHRDVKPANVMVVAEPAAGAGFAKLTDFGVASLAGGDGLTNTGDVIGTLAYMAPEQAEGRRVGAEADAYSLALTLFEAWTGSNPVRRRGAAATARRVGRRLPSLRSRRRDLPPALCDAVDGALERDPGRRSGVDALRDALVEYEHELSDDGGLVEDGTLERFGLDRARGGLFGGGEPEPFTFGTAALRCAAGLGAGALVLLSALLAPTAPVSPEGAALVAAALVALLPRAGFLLAAAAVLGWLAWPSTGRAGTALVLAAALACAPLMLPRAPRLWCVPALAPLLGSLGLAPAYLALAGLGSSVGRRAGLAACGFAWLSAAQLIAGKALLFGMADGTAAPEEWRGSAAQAASEALYPLLSSPLTLTAAVWATLAAVFPLLVRGASLGFDLAGGTVWAAGVVAAHRALEDLLASSVAIDDSRGAVLGALAAVGLALALGALRRRGLSAAAVRAGSFP